MRFVLSVTGKDRPGIIASLTRACYELGGNLEDASMTILAGEFAMILLVSFISRKAAQALRARLKQLAKRERLSISVEPPHRGGASPQKRAKAVTRYLLSAFGKDRAGIVYRLTQLLAKHRLNITDLNSKLIRTKKKDIYGLLVEVDVPVHYSLKRLETELRRLASRLKVDFNMKPVEPVVL